MGRTRDDCLNFFDVVEFYGNFRLYQCRYCSKNIKSSSSTRLKSHLKRCKGYKALGDTVDAPFKKLLVDLFVNYNLPQKLLTDKNFSKLFTIAPSMLKNVQKVFGEVADIISDDIPTSYVNKFAETIRNLKRKSSLVLSIDTLNDSLGRETFYLTVISDKRFYHIMMEEYTNTLLTEERVFKKCQDLFNKIDPERFICVVSENQNVLNNTKRKIILNHPNISNITCSATLFHQLAKKVLTQKTQICDCIDKCSTINEIMKNDINVAKYVKRLTRQDIPIYNESRWCSIYDFLVFIVEKKSIIESALEEDALAKFFNDEFWDVCSETISLLHPFSIALKIAENPFSNMSNVYIPYLTIKNHLINQSTSNILINDFVSKMNNNMLEFCYLINPLHSIEDIENMDTKNSEEFIMSQTGHGIFIEDFQSFVYKTGKFENTFEGLSDPIVWWKLNRYNSPELSDLAVKYLSIPASSVLIKNNLINVVDKILLENQSRKEDIDKLVFISQENENYP